MLRSCINFIILCFGVALVPAVVGFSVVPKAASGSLRDDWITSSYPFNAAPLLFRNSSGAPTSTAPVNGDVYFAYSAEDTLAAVQHALDAGYVRLQGRSGRHSYTAVSATTVGAAVIDVSNLKSVGQVRQVECPTAEDGPCYAVEVGTGLRLFELYAGLGEQGFMFPGGTCPTVGVAGFILGGGIGLWARVHGTGSDNVISAQVIVPANTTPPVSRRVARMITVNESSDAEHLLGLRGAGTNNFGIVTALTVRVFRAPSVVSRWRLNLPNYTACRDEAMPLFERAVTAAWAHNATERSSVSVSLDVYRGACAFIVVGYNMTARRLSELLVTHGWLGITGVAPSPISGPTEADWLLGVAGTEGCQTLAECHARVETEFPDPAKPGRWQALTSFQFEPMSELNRRAFFDAVNSTLNAQGHDGKGNRTFGVVIVDMLGGAMNASSQSKDTSTAFVHHSAAYHVQMLAYLATDDLEQSAAAWRWAARVLTVLDAATVAAGRPPAAYRNYPSLMLPNANMRYYGTATLERLRKLKRTVDPEGWFDYEQGI